MKILDATCGNRSMWYQKNHPFATYLDIRREVLHTVTEPGRKLRGARTVAIKPEIVADFRNTPFEDDHFDLVLFDPPHLIYNGERKQSQMVIRYGMLRTSEYRRVIREGAAELFRVLKPNGILVLKWCEVDRTLAEILGLFPYRPLFGTRTGQRNNTHWVLFLKHRREATLEGWES